MYTKILIYHTYYWKKFKHNTFFLCYKYNPRFLGNFFYTIIQIKFSNTQNTSKKVALLNIYVKLLPIQTVYYGD